MKKISIFPVCCFVILIAVGVSLSALEAQPVMTVYHFLNGKASLTLNETPFKKLMDKATKRTLKSSNVHLELHASEISILPNPVKSNAQLTFELFKNSKVKVFAYNSNSEQKVCFDGFLNQGKNEISVNLSDINKGFLIFYFEIEGIVFSAKTIKI